MQITSHPQYISGLHYGEPGGKISAITHCAETFFVRGHYVLPHSHAGFEFIYLSRGSATRFVGRDRVRHRMGDLYITYPRERHRVACGKSEEGRQIQIGLRLDLLGPEGSRVARHLRRHKTRVLHDSQSVEPVLQAIISQIVTGLPHREEAILAYLHAFCVLIRQSAARGKTRAGSGTQGALPYSYPVQKALFFMKKHLDRRLPLSEMAAAATALNVCRFCTQFHREVRMSPAAYHLQLRLDSARQALLQPGMDVTSVAMQYGFCSSQHFWKAFRRAFKVSPRAWKKKQRESAENSPA